MGAVDDWESGVSRKPTLPAGGATYSDAGPKHRPRVAITRREAQVLQGVVNGESNAEIARRLTIREQTVKNHISVLLQKLHVRNRVQLAVLVAREWPELLR